MFACSWWKLVQNLLFLKATPLRVCLTGAAGQIAYSLLYSISKGDVFGKDQVITSLYRCIQYGAEYFVYRSK